MNRKKNFAQPKQEQVTIRDSRFGIRRMFLNPQERPRIHVPQLPGKGPNGESQN
jgi:hypothetical protein